MTEEVAGGPVEERRTSPVPGDQSPALDDTQQRARASDVEEPAPSAPSVWPRYAWATANPRSGTLSSVARGPILVVGSTRLPSCRAWWTG
jgi:hypothetical protein